MLVNLKTKKLNFPIDIFGNKIAESFKELSSHYSTPIDYLCLTGLWAVSSQMGNCYKVDMNGSIKSILFCMMVGPSSIGKTVAHDVIYGNIVHKRAKDLYSNYLEKEKEWKRKKEQVKNGEYGEVAGQRPNRKIRSSTGGTLEAIAKYASTNPAGFGIYFDEGKKLYQGGNYSKVNNSVEFWNDVWNGRLIDDLRKDADLETVVYNPCISILAGMQTKRITEMFDKDTIDSGLLNRFLFVQSDYVELNENIDHFSKMAEPCYEWQNLILHLFEKGIYYSDGNEVLIPFANNETKELFNEVANGYTKEANKRNKNRKDGDASELLTGYMGKLHAYFKRLVMICAVIHNYENPVINEHVISNADYIYRYFQQQAEMLLTSISDSAESGLKENVLKLFNLLPDKFTLNEANDLAEQLNLSRKYFINNYNRHYSKGWIRRMQDKTFEKITAS